VPPVVRQEETDEIHGWLSERIASLEKERQSTWERVMSSLLGR
jgi:hypothetical protein